VGFDFQKILEISERICDFPQKIRYKIDQIKFYWSHFKWPKFWQWKKTEKFLNKREKITLLVFFTLFLGSLFFLIINFYFTRTHFVPAPGGKYIEGVIGSPELINPIYADLKDIDRDLVEILFSGLMKYDSRGEIRPDLAEKVETKEDGKKIEVYLKPDIFWSDGKKITADDVIFTIETIQDPDYKSPLITNWLGIKVEKISDIGVSFELKKPYGAFLERLTLKIIPKHIWENISSQKFRLFSFNLSPIGSGPYRLKILRPGKEGFIKSVILEPNPFYHQKHNFTQKPYLSEISFVFFDKEEDLIAASKNGEINGFSLTSLENLPQLETDQGLVLYSFSLPRYFALFFNLNPPVGESEILVSESIREALNYGTDKKEIIEEILKNRAEIVHSPILPEIYGFDSPKNFYDFNLEKAKEILDSTGYKETDNGLRQKIVKKGSSFEFKSRLQMGSRGKDVEGLQKCLAKDPEIYPEGKITGYFGSETKEAVIKFQEKYYQDVLKPWGFQKGTGIVYKTTMDKLNQVCFGPETETIPLKFSLITVEDSLLLKVADLLKNQWQKLGIGLEIKSYPVSQIEKEIIKPRNYEILLFGESLGIIPDPFPFWHSSQKKDPGLNLTGYENKTVDKLLEEARTNLDPKERCQKLQEFQEILIKDSPCIFLFSPDYLHFVSNQIKGIESGIIVDPSKRFLGIEKWYIKEKRVWMSL